MELCRRPDLSADWRCPVHCDTEGPEKHRGLPGPDRHGSPDAEEQAMFAAMKASMEDFFNLSPEAAGADAGKESSENPEAWTEEEAPQTQSRRENQRTRPKTAR